MTGREMTGRERTDRAANDRVTIARRDRVTIGPELLKRPQGSRNAKVVLVARIDHDGQRVNGSEPDPNGRRQNPDPRRARLRRARSNRPNADGLDPSNVPTPRTNLQVAWTKKPVKNSHRHVHGVPSRHVGRRGASMNSQANCSKKL